MPGRIVRRTWAHDPTLNAPARWRRACHYEAFIPDPLAGFPVLLDRDLAGLVSEAEGAIRSLNDVARPGLAPLARFLLRTESIASSKVEGLQVGVRQLARAEGRVEAGRAAAPTAMEVLANIDAMELAVYEAADVARFGIDEILAIHRALMEQGPHPGIAGTLRRGQNWIGGNDFNPCGADFVPPPPEELDALLHDLCDALNDRALPPVVQAALVHAQFETLHPFDDGNGRTGRALIHVVLRRRGLASAYVPPISVHLANARDHYITGLTSFRGDRVEPWIETFAEACVAAARLAESYLRAVEGLQEEWRRRLAASPKPPRADAAAWGLIDVLPAHPIITGPVAAAALGRSKPQTYLALEQLEGAGVLRPLGPGRRNRSWEATGLLELVEGIEQGRAPGR